MIKPASLRSALSAAIPTLRDDPDKLSVFVEEGSIGVTGTRSLSFEYRYVLNVLVLDFAGNPDEVMIPLLEWMGAHQADMLANSDSRDSKITFEVDLMNNDTADLSIKVPLSESVVVATDCKGRRLVRHVDDSSDNWTTL